MDQTHTADTHRGGPAEPVLWRGGHEEGCPAEVGGSSGKRGERTKHNTQHNTTHNTIQQQHTHTLMLFFCPEFSFLFCPNVFFVVPRVCFVPTTGSLFCPVFVFFVPLRFFLSRYRPTGLAFKLQPVDFRTLALERLRLPLQISEVACVCGTRLDSRGRHREGTVRHVHDQVFCGSERPPPRGHSLGSVVKPVQQCVATRSFET